MLSYLTTTIAEWFIFLKNILYNFSLVQLLEAMIILLVASGLLFLFSKGMSYLLKHTLELAKILAKVASLLTLLLLALVILRTILDPNRPCYFTFEEYFTRCRVIGPGYTQPRW